MPEHEVLFGVAGWSYADWKDVVYPRNCKDTLRAVAQRVDLIEINSTFYGVPQAKNSKAWVERTADLGTRFTAKLPRELTHDRKLDDTLVAQTLHGFQPLLASGRLLGLLAQFNHELHFTPPSVAHIGSLARAFGSHALFVEVRHPSWNADGALGALRDLGVGVLELDYPGNVSGFSRDVTGVHAPGGLAYFRLHGRNRAWFKKGSKRDEVYDWRYSPGEVEQLGERVERIAAGATRTIVVANNHFQGKAMLLVEELLAWYRGTR